jgi:PTS system sucrose-specific IIC component
MNGFTKRRLIPKIAASVIPSIAENADGKVMAWVVSMHVYMTAVGLTAIPGMAIVQASSLLNYIIGMAIG